MPFWRLLLKKYNVICLCVHLCLISLKCMISLKCNQYHSFEHTSRSCDDVSMIEFNLAKWHHQAQNGSQVYNIIANMCVIIRLHHFPVLDARVRYMIINELQIM